jgi:nitroreductase
MHFPQKPAPADVPILDPIRDRWSPVAFSPRTVEPEKIRTLFEAARWAPSSYNEQPWRYVYAQKDDGEARAAIESLLVEGNAWAKNAGFLMVTFAKKTFDRNGKENRHAMHDAGCATGYVLLQLSSLGLIGHSMAGFDWQGANVRLGVSDDYIAASMTAIGYHDDSAAAELHAREASPRVRNPQSAFVFHDTWPSA